MRPKREFPKVVRHGSVAVKVYRVKHRTTASGWAYVVAYRAPDGSRQLPQFAEEKAAMDEAQIKAEQIATGRAEGVEMSRSDRDELQAARDIVGKTPVLAALREWVTIRDLTSSHGIAAAEAWAARNNSTGERITVGEAIKRFTAAKVRAGVDVKSSYNKILPSLNAHAGDQMLHAISGRELQQWLDSRYPHPVSRNTARKRVVALWRWGRKQGYLPRDVMTEAEQTDTAREEVTRIGVINAPTFRRLLEHFAARHPEYLAPLALAGFCGLRRSEIHDQDWDDVDLQRKFVRVSAAKRNTPARRLVPLAGAAVEWLMQCGVRKGRLCHNLAIDRIRNIAHDAGFDLPDNCFRHSFISHRVAQTGDVASTALEAGNSAQVIFRHYRELFTKAQGKAWFSIRPGMDTCGASSTEMAPRRGEKPELSE